MKKIIFLGLAILLIAAGGFFWWWQGNQKDVKELNKNLPEGIRVAKSFLGEYKVINKIDGYEFKVPSKWERVSEIIYKDITNTELSIGEDIGEGIQRKIISESHLLIEGIGARDGIEMRVLKFSDSITLKTFAEEFKEAYMPYRKTEISEFSPNIEDFIVENLKGLKLYTLVQSKYGDKIIASDQYYFFAKDSKIYIIIHFNDGFVREFITGGKW